MDCTKCKHVGSVPGDTHKCCKHPDISGADEILALLGGSSPILRKLGIKADPHGVKMGWFMWPTNFDPTWLLNCNGFEEKEI